MRFRLSIPYKEQAYGFFAAQSRSRETMYQLSQSIQVVKANKFLLPREESVVIIRDPQQFGHIELCYLLEQEIGIPFWLGESPHVFGCSAKILKTHINKKLGFMRVHVSGLQLFRVTGYSKCIKEGLPSAQVTQINYLDRSVGQREILGLFEKCCNAVTLVELRYLTFIDMFRELNLDSRLFHTMLAAPSQKQREELLKNILKFKVTIMRQKKIYELN